MYNRSMRILISIIVVTSVSSIKTDWNLSIKLCRYSNYRPANINDIVKKNTWIGEAMYKFDWGNVQLNIEESNPNRTCSARDGNCANMDKCKFCDISHIDLQSAWEMLNNLTQNRKYIVADFKNLQEIPEPQRCLMRSENLTKYVICKQEHEDGCQPTENFSNLKIILQVYIRTSSANELKIYGGFQMQVSGVLMLEFLILFFI